MVSQEKRHQTGVQGEDAAVDYLRANGYKILDRNWHCCRGEVDIVAAKGDILAFVEVKTRAANASVTPFAAVTSPKQRRLIYTAALYLSCHNYDLQPRFDVAAVTQTPTGYRVEYLPHAFEAGEYYY